VEQEFLIGGYIRGARGFDALLVGVYENKQLTCIVIKRRFSGLKDISRYDPLGGNGPASHRYGQRFTPSGVTWTWVDSL
jgi:hypothetical protein